MRGALLAVAIGLGLVAAAFAAFAWAPWEDDVDVAAERAWLSGYDAWWREIASAIEGNVRGPQLDCAGSFGRSPGPVPIPAFERAASAAVRACARLGAAVRSGTAPADRLDLWVHGDEEFRSLLVAGRMTGARATTEPRLAAAVEAIATRPVEVRCWPAEPWEAVERDVAASSEVEFRLAGLADVHAGGIHLDETVCELLRRFYGSAYQPSLSEDTARLADSLAILAHEAHHIAAPGATEAEVECYAIQEVQGMVERAGRGAGYARELALIAWELGYPENFESYRTRDCRDGGRLDRRPDDDRWP